MAEFTQETAIQPIMLALVEEVEVQLARFGLPAAAFSMLQAGDTPVIDHAGNPKGGCSELIVNLATTYPVASDGFPDPDATGTCSSEFAYEIEVSLFRCAPAMGPGNPPTPPSVTEQTEATFLHLADMKAVRCAIAKVLKPYQYVLRGFTPYGPLGGAVGGTWLMVVGGEI